VCTRPMTQSYTWADLGIFHNGRQSSCRSVADPAKMWVYGSIFIEKHMTLNVEVYMPLCILVILLNFDRLKITTILFN